MPPTQVEGVLYLKTSPKQKDWNDMRLVLPQAYHVLVMCGCHNNIGHLDAEHMLNLLCDWFYWPMMQNDANQHIWGCGRCNQFKACLNHEELYPILAMYPLKQVHIDFLTIKNPKNGKHLNVLVITHHFTRYVQAKATTLQTVWVMGQGLWDGFFTHYGFPAIILSEEGHNFERSPLKELCDLGDIHKIHTTPYHPPGNGQCEWFNFTLISMIGIPTG